MCTDGINDMFEAKEWNLTEYKINCKNTWKVTPRENFETLMYGAKKLHAASNIVFRYPLTVSNKSPGSKSNMNGIQNSKKLQCDKWEAITETFL